MFDWPTFVRTLRDEQYLSCSQEELARQLEVSVSSVSKWERGLVKPRWRHRSALFRLANKVGYGRGQ